MYDSKSLKNLILTSYFFNKENNIFLLKPNKKKSVHDSYNETAEKIQIVRTLNQQEIEFEELNNGDIKIV